MLFCVSCYPASMWVFLYSLNVHQHWYKIFSTYKKLIWWTAHMLQMCQSYIHYSYLQKYLAWVVFLFFVFDLLQVHSVLKSNEAKRTRVPFYKNLPFWESKGTSKKTEHWVRREGFHLDSQQYSNFQQQTQTRSQTISHTPLHITITLLHCL